MFIYDEKIEAYGLDRKKVASIARRISKAAREASALGLTVFGGSGSGSLRYSDSGSSGVQTVVAFLDGNFDGGDGGDEF